MACRAALRWSGDSAGLKRLLAGNGVAETAGGKKQGKVKLDRHLTKKIFQVRKDERELVKSKTSPRRKKVTKFYKDRENQFLMLWDAMAPDGLPKPVAQHRFHGERRFRLDWAWPQHRVGVEIHGGVFLKQSTGHRSIGGVTRDLEKGNLAVVSGWRVLCFHANDLDKNPGKMIQMVVEVLMGGTQE